MLSILFLQKCMSVWWPLIWGASLLLYTSKYVLSVMDLSHLQLVFCVCVCVRLFMNYIIKWCMFGSCDNCVNCYWLWVAVPWTVLFALKCTTLLVDYWLSTSEVEVVLCNIVPCTIQCLVITCLKHCTLGTSNVHVLCVSVLSRLDHALWCCQFLCT